jgi:hypothetical protein
MAPEIEALIREAGSVVALVPEMREIEIVIRVNDKYPMH